MTEISTSDTENPVFSRPKDIRSLNRATGFEFDEVPTDPEREAISELLELRSLTKMRFKGALQPLGDKGWQLTATLGATVTQSCIVTLEPVRSRIDIDVKRRFLPQKSPLADEIELDSNVEDDLEPLRDTIDTGLIAIEELALALPPYPRATGADLESFAKDQDVTINTPPDNPFDALKALQDKLKQTP